MLQSCRIPTFGNFDKVQKLIYKGRLKEALHLLEFMAQQTSEAPQEPFVYFLRECTRRKALAEGKQVHALIFKTTCGDNVFLSNLLIEMYSTCGSVAEALKVFTAMPQRNVFSWTAMVSAYAKCREYQGALTFFLEMQKAGVEPDEVACIIALKACANVAALEQGQRLHSVILMKGFDSNLTIQNTLVNMYSKCGSLQCARELFDSMTIRNVVSWNSMLAGYTQEGLGKEALHLYREMQGEGMEPDHITFILLLKACASISALQQGKQLHSLIVGKCLESNLIQTALLDMYCKCRCLKDAHEVFNTITTKDVVSWNAMIAGYAQEGLGKEALDLYEQMKREGVERNKTTLVLLLKACASISALQQGKQLHSLILKKGLEYEVIVQTTLIHMYSKCGCLKDAHALFDNMTERTVVAWTALIAGYTQEGLGREALGLFYQMKCEGMEPDNITVVLLLKACASISALQQGKQLHSSILQKGWSSLLIVQNSLIDMYSKCGCVKDARELFDTMTERDIISWNSMIASYVQDGHGSEALDLYEKMECEDMAPNSVTLIFLLKACANVSALQQGKQLHSLILRKGLESEPIIQTTLLDMYTKCKCLKDARELFDNMAEPNVVSWTVMIAGYAQEGLGQEALNLYEQMKHENMEPNSITLVFLLKACAVISALQQGKQLHSLILEKFLESEPIIQSALIDMYSKCGCLKYARELFDNMTEQNVSSLTAIIAGYAKEGFGKEALDLFEQMHCEGMEPDYITLVVLLKACASITALKQGKQLHTLILEKGLECKADVQTALVDMYSKCGCLKDARELFDNMTKPNVISWTAMIAGYVQEGLGKEALNLYTQMKLEGMEPDNITFILLLKACASISALQQGKQLHTFIIEKGLESDVMIQTGLVDMYAKCGCLEDARELFENMAERNVVSWTVIIAGYAQKGLGKEALDLLQQMKDDGIQANEITYICVLAACSHSSSVDEGRQVFESMSKDFSVMPTLKHYACMVDILGRAGSLSDAPRKLF